MMERQILRWAGIGLLLAVLSTPSIALDFNVIVDEATVTTAGIAGFAGDHSTTVLRQPGNDALLYGIGGGERSDQPCYVELFWSRKNKAEEKYFTTKFWLDPCSDEHHSYEQNLLTYMPPVNGIAEIEVCTNNKEPDLLKGVNITAMRDISESGNADVHPVITDGVFKRANCNTWNHPSRCDANKVAIGVNIFHQKEGVTGLQLICATTRLSYEVPVVPEFSLDTSSAPHITSVSGFPGTPIRAGAPTGFGVGSIQNFERRDQPCELSVGSEAVREPLVAPWNSTMLRYDVANRCGGGTPGDRIRVELGATDAWWQGHQDELFQAFVSGIRICMNNDGTRLKGIEVKARSIRVDGARIVVEEMPLKTDAAQDFRAHCNPGNWRNWVDCPTNQVASAVIAHFAAGQPPRSITGLALECRNVVTGG